MKEDRDTREWRIAIQKQPFTTFALFLSLPCLVAGVLPFFESKYCTLAIVVTSLILMVAVSAIYFAEKRGLIPRRIQTLGLHVMRVILLVGAAACVVGFVLIDDTPLRIRLGVMLGYLVVPLAMLKKFGNANK